MLNIELAVVVLLSLSCNINGTCEVLLDRNGRLDLTHTLFSCADNITDNRFPYSHVDPSEPVVVSTQITLNNLYGLDEIDGTATIDMVLRLIWNDPRWDIPDLWNYIDVIRISQGIAITDLVFPDQYNLPLNVWIPDLELRDASDIKSISRTFRLRPNGTLYYFQHIMVTLAQPNLDFNPYPLDNQHIEIVMHSTSYSTAQVRLNYSDPAVLYVSTPDGKDINFEKNVIWLHESGDWHAWSERQITILGNDDTKKMYDIQTVLLRVTRESDGVVIRFMLPILALMILAGWIFWIATDQRADATMNVLVAVSAMYIVIFSNIPLVGYMTTMDIYIVEVFGVLVLCIGVHHFSMRLDSKSGKIPVRRFLIRVVEALGRMFVIPFCIFSFFILFGSGSLRVFKIPVYTGVSLFAITIAVRERAGLNKEFRIMIEDIEAKKEALLLGESRELFWSEVVVYAIYNSTCCRTRNEAFRRGKSEYLNQKMSILEKIESRRSSASINEQGNPLGETNYDPSSDRVGQMGKEGVIKGEFAIETGGNDDL